MYRGGAPQEWLDKLEEEDEREVRISRLKIEMERLKQKRSALADKLRENPADPTIPLEMAAIEMQLKTKEKSLTDLLKLKVHVVQRKADAEQLENYIEAVQDMSDANQEAQGALYWLPWAKREQKRVERESAKMDSQMQRLGESLNLSERAEEISAVATSVALSSSDKLAHQRQALTQDAASSMAMPAIVLAANVRHDLSSSSP